MDFNKQGSLGGVAGDGGELVVLRNGTKVFSLDVPPPNFSAEKYRDSVVDNYDYFSDEFDNNDPATLIHTWNLKTSKLK